MTRTLALVAGLALAAVAHGGGALKGTVTGGLDDPRPLADAVVLVDAPPSPPAHGAPHPVIDQRGEAFVPRVLAVPVGTTVDFANSDPFLHNVVSSSPARTFDLGMFGTGERRSVTFDRPGVVHVGCALHPRMAAIVVVHPNPWVAVTDARGGYTVTGVPAGRHEVRVWHQDYPEKRATVTVYEAQVQSLDVALGARR